MRDAAAYEPYLAMLEFGQDVTMIEAEKRAEKCFHVQAWIVRDLVTAEYKELLTGDDIEMTKSELMLQVPSAMSNADSRKAWIYTQPSRRDKVEKAAKATAHAQYLKRLLKLFESAQFYYAAKAKR